MMTARAKVPSLMSAVSALLGRLLMFWVLGFWTSAVGAADISKPTCVTQDPLEYRELVLDGYRHLLHFELEDARVLLSHAVQQQPCLTRVLSPQLLAHAWLELGLVRQHQGDVEGARDAFRRALLLHPDLPWNRQFGMLGESLLEAERLRLQRLEPQRLRLPRLTVRAQVFLDGREVSRPNRPLVLVPGQHLLQIVQNDQVIYARWVDSSLGEIGY